MESSIRTTKRMVNLFAKLGCAFVLFVVVIGCTTTPPPPFTATHEARPTFESTATQKSTPTSEPTAAQKPSLGPTANLISLNFTRYENNPVLTAEPANLWEAGVRFSTVVFIEGIYHLFYTGGNPFEGGDPGNSDAQFKIGYATSTDGFQFTKFEGNPILEGDGSGFDAYSVSRPVVVVDGETWVLYYTAHAKPGHPLGGPAIGRATATNPAGPWERDPEPVLKAGSSTEWDGEPGWFGVVPSSVLVTDEGYVMYYTSHHLGDVAGPRVGGACGMATSPDGIHWTKYDDPATTRSPLADSDPVLRPGGPHDNLHAMDCRAFKSADGWGMVYASLRGGDSGHRINFASSPDGIHWTKNELDRPLYGPQEEPLAAQSEFSDVWPDAIIWNGSDYLLYYDIGCCPPIGIGVATGAK